MGIGKYPFKEPAAITALRQFENERKRIRDALRPTLEFQKHVEQLSMSSQIFRDMAKEQQRMSDLVKALDPLRGYRELLKTDHSMMARNSAWQNALKAQNLFDLSDSVKSTLKGITLTDELQKALEAMLPGPRVSDVLGNLKMDTVYVGEYGLDESESDSEESSELILPESVEAKLESVNYFPISLFERVLRDPALTRKISPTDFEYFVADLIEILGFTDVNVTERSGDGGRDIIATRTINEIKMLFAFECKRYAPNRKIQLDTMRALLGTVAHSESKANMGVLVTTSSFTKGSRKLILSEALIDGKDFDDLVLWINMVNKGKNC